MNGDTLLFTLKIFKINILPVFDYREKYLKIKDSEDQYS